jgi:hypothetical protein
MNCTVPVKTGLVMVLVAGMEIVAVKTVGVPAARTEGVDVMVVMLIPLPTTKFADAELEVA